MYPSQGQKKDKIPFLFSYNKKEKSSSLCSSYIQINRKKNFKRKNFQEGAIILDANLLKEILKI